MIFKIENTSNKININNAKNNKNNFMSGVNILFLHTLLFSDNIIEEISISPLKEQITGVLSKMKQAATDATLKTNNNQFDDQTLFNDIYRLQMLLNNFKGNSIITDDAGLQRYTITTPTTITQFHCIQKMCKHLQIIANKIFPQTIDTNNSSGS